MCIKMGKEIWKLLKLLNEYEKESNLKSEIFWEKSEFIVISKKFWFIKWLVENEKIDFSREWEYSTKSIEEFDWLLRDDSDWLIMLLAIQDEPIRFLCEILK